MLKNYIKIAFRNLWKHKVDSAISIGGLAVGLACCILLVLYVRFELSYDSFHENSDRVYRVIRESTYPPTGEVSHSASQSIPMAAAIESAFPEMEWVIKDRPYPVEVEIDNKFNMHEAKFVDPGFFRAFTFPFIAGDSETALAEPNNIVLTEAMAERIFGPVTPASVMGEAVVIRFAGGEQTFRVTGITEPVPENSSIRFELVLPFEAYYFIQPEQREFEETTWDIGVIQIWTMLNPNSSIEGLEERLDEFMISAHPNTGWVESRNMKASLQPFEDIYFSQEITSYYTAQGNRLYPMILGGIAFVILSIAGINFISLTLSRASGRQSEIGIRKVVGARRFQIGGQFFGEVFATSALALALGVVLAELMIPLFQTIVQKPIELTLFGDVNLWVLLAALLLVTTLITGAYPALVISGRMGSATMTSHRTAERIPVFVKGLIAVQFTLSIAFLVTAFIMQSQMNFIYNSDLGYSKSNVITVELPPLMGGQQRNEVAQVLSTEARRLPGVESASISTAYIREGVVGLGPSGMVTAVDGLDGEARIETADENWLETLSIELIAGSNFSLNQSSDILNGIIINQRFAELAGLENPVGSVLLDMNDRGNTFPLDGKRVIGVMEDYHFQPFYESIGPLVLMHNESRSSSGINTIFIKVREGEMGQAISDLSAIWDEVLPSDVFQYGFLDERYRQMYAEEQRWSRVMQASSGVTILLACFGLFGLASLAARRRTKEIGIRKVMGATLANIMVLLNRDFLKLVSIGFIFAIPIAWYVMNRWLEDFAYRIEIGPGVFLLAGFSAILIALITVSWLSVRAAQANPVDSLRME